MPARPKPCPTDRPQAVHPPSARPPDSAVDSAIDSAVDSAGDSAVDHAVDPAAVAAREAGRLIALLHVRLIEQVEQDARAAGVVPFAWFEVLAALETPGRGLRLRDLVATVLLTRAGVSRLTDRIEAAGLLRREPCVDDGRGALAVLTPAGATALHRARPVYARTMNQRLARHLAPPQTQALLSTLRAVLTANDWLPAARPVPLTVRRRPGGRT